MRKRKIGGEEEKKYVCHIVYFHEKEKNRRGRKNMFITLCIFMRTRKIGGEEEKKYVYHIVYFYENEKNRSRGRGKNMFMRIEKDSLNVRKINFFHSLLGLIPALPYLDLN